MVLTLVREVAPILVGPVLGSLANFVLASTVSRVIKKALDGKVRVAHSEDYEVFCLHSVRLKHVRNTLNVLVYSNAEYTPNPILHDTEKKLDGLP